MHYDVLVTVKELSVKCCKRLTLNAHYLGYSHVKKKLFHSTAQSPVENEIYPMIQ